MMTTCISLKMSKFTQTFAALGDPTRMAILSRLAAQGDLTVQEIADPVAMSLPAVSQHLKVLERAGLIARGRDGQKRPCSLRAERLAEATRWLNHTRKPGKHASTALVDSLQRQRRKVTTMNADPRTSWAIDREIVLSRVIAAPRERVFQAWTDPRQITQWFRLTASRWKAWSATCGSADAGASSTPALDGTRYANRMVFLRLEAPRLIEMEHGSDKDNDPARFHVTVTFDAQSDGKTVLTMRQLHPTKEQRDATIGFGAVEFGYQTLGKLARYLGVS